MAAYPSNIRSFSEDNITATVDKLAKDLLEAASEDQLLKPTARSEKGPTKTDFANKMEELGLGPMLRSGTSSQQNPLLEEIGLSGSADKAKSVSNSSAPKRIGSDAQKRPLIQEVTESQNPFPMVEITNLAGEEFPCSIITVRTDVASDVLQTCRYKVNDESRMLLMSSEKWGESNYKIPLPKHSDMSKLKLLYVKDKDALCIFA